MSAELVDTYGHALCRGEVEGLLDVLAADAVFQSPFRVWRGPLLRGVYTARAAAFDNLRIDAQVRDTGRAVILWHATVAGAWVEASEVVSLGDGAIVRVDVFLRPADVLGSVYQAMVRSWPDR